MATATKKSPPVTLDLSTEEAASLYTLLCGEKWPANETDIECLNDIFGALVDADVEDSETFKTDED